LAARASEHLSNGVEVCPNDRVAGIQLQRSLPAADRLIALLPAQANVAQLEVDVVSQLRIQLRGAQVRLHRLVITSSSIVEIAEILVDLRQPSILLQGALGGGLR